MVTPQFIRQTVEALGLPPVTVLPSRVLTGSFYDPDNNEGRAAIHVRALSGDAEKLALHEIGHHFLETYYGTIIGKALFRKLFGRFNESYTGIWRYIPFQRYFRPTALGYVTAYAQNHPHEDFAETFAEVMNEGEPLDYGDDALNEKIEFVWACLQKAKLR